jgi:hypothetical protein
MRNFKGFVQGGEAGMHNPREGRAGSGIDWLKKGVVFGEKGLVFANKGGLRGTKQT